MWIVKKRQQVWAHYGVFYCYLCGARYYAGRIKAHFVFIKEMTLLSQSEDIRDTVSSPPNYDKNSSKTQDKPDKISTD